MHSTSGIPTTPAPVDPGNHDAPRSLTQPPPISIRMHMFHDHYTLLLYQSLSSSQLLPYQPSLSGTRPIFIDSTYQHPIDSRKSRDTQLGALFVDDLLRRVPSPISYSNQSYYGIYACVVSASYTRGDALVQLGGDEGHEALIHIGGVKGHEALVQVGGDVGNIQGDVVDIRVNTNEEVRMREMRKRQRRRWVREFLYVRIGSQARQGKRFYGCREKYSENCCGIPVYKDRKSGPPTGPTNSSRGGEESEGPDA